jgi:hypothetical protein
LMEHYRRQAHVMQNAGPVAVADLIEHYRRQAYDMRSAEMGTAILQVAHWLLSGLRRRLSEERQQMVHDRMFSRAGAMNRSAFDQFRVPRSAWGVRRDKAALSSGCRSHPATA